MAEGTTRRSRQSYYILLVLLLVTTQVPSVLLSFLSSMAKLKTFTLSSTVVEKKWKKRQLLCYNVPLNFTKLICLRKLCLRSVSTSIRETFIEYLAGVLVSSISIISYTRLYEAHPCTFCI